MPKKYKEVHLKFVEEAQKLVGVGGVITRKQAKDVAKGLGQLQPNWLFNDREYRSSRGGYKLPVLTETTSYVNNSSSVLTETSL